MYNILIAESIPCLNKGELTILGGMIESFKEIGAVRVSILSANPDLDKTRYKTDMNIIDVRKPLFIPADHLSKSIWDGLLASIMSFIKHVAFISAYKIFGKSSLKVFKDRLWKEYLDADIIFIGHNGTFGIGGNLLPNIPYFSYFSYLYIPFLGKFLDTPTVIYGGSISDFKHNHKILYRWLSYMLSNVTLITLREESAYTNLIKMGVKNDNALVTADLAFLLQPSNDDRIGEIIKNEGLNKLPRPLIGFTVFQKIARKGENGYDGHIKMMADVIDSVIERKNASVVFIPHSIGFGIRNDDRIISKEIFDLCVNKDRIRFITKEYSAEDLKGILGYVDVLVGERLHSVINALCMHKPSLILAYIGDIRLDIIRMIGQESIICYVDNLNSLDLIYQIELLIENSDQIRDELQVQIPVMIERSRVNSRKLKELLK